MGFANGSQPRRNLRAFLIKTRLADFFEARRRSSKNIQDTVPIFNLYGGIEKRHD